ncbi:MAG: general secretion pathway protein GspK, partial [Candidatus Sumerlaeota bacterium]
MIALRQNRSRRAVILLLTIWIVIVLGLLAQSLSYEMRVESQLSALNRDQFRVRQLARLGVARATTDLRNDNLLMGAADMDWRNRFDAFGDVWADGSLLPRTYEITPPDDSDPIGHYTILVVDEESKLDINNEKTMEAIEYLIRMLGEDEEDARDIAEAIWDWKDNDDEPIGKKGTSEIEHYARELDMDLDVESSRLYLPKNAKFDTVDELLGIPGMTPELFYG